MGLEFSVFGNWSDKRTNLTPFLIILSTVPENKNKICIFCDLRYFLSFQQRWIIGQASVRVDWLSTQKMVPMDRYEAYALTSIAVDCDITQIVDIRKGVHCMVPKSIFVKK